MIPDADVPANRGIAAMFSSTVRNDNWVLPRLLRVLAMVGNVELDLSQVRMGLGVSTIEVVAWMGNVEITVPAGLAVECEGHPLIGSFEFRRPAWSAPPTAPEADAPVLRITGFALLGNVEITIARGV